MKTPTKHFVTLDGLRGIAVLLVVLSHLSNFGFHLLLVDFSGIGKCGVYLFFVLSAFLLTYQFLEKGMDNSFSLLGLGNYVWRRSLRVLPLFYLVVIVSALTTHFFSGYLYGHGLPFTIPTADVIPHLLLQAGTEVLWSVPVEYKFYFLLPVLSACFLLTGEKRFYLDALIAAIAIIATIRFYPPDTLQGSSVLLGYFLPVFICGCLCASAAYKIPMNQSSRLPNAIACAIGLIVLLTVPSIYSALITPISPSYFHKSFMLYGVLWSMFLYAVLHSKGLLQKLLSTAPLIFLGRISFSLYLLHFPVLLMVRKLAPGNMLAAWFALAIIIGGSYTSYRLIEMPLSRIKWLDVIRGIQRITGRLPIERSAAEQD